MVQKAGRNGKALTRRRDILHAAARVFRERGLADAGMRDIAREADLSPGNLYYYFKNKGELVYFCQAQALDRMLDAAFDGSAPTATEHLRHIIAAHLDATLNTVDGAAAHTEVDVLPPALRQRIVAKRDRYERAIRSVIESGIRTGEFRPLHAELVTRAILGALNWASRWYDPDGRLAAADLADTFGHYLIQGLKK